MSKRNVGKSSYYGKDDPFQNWIKEIGNVHDKAIAIAIWEFLDFDRKTAMEVFYFWKTRKIVLSFDQNDKIIQIKKITWKK